MTNDLSFFSLVLQAGLIVQTVLLLLLMASIASWAIIVRKRALLKAAGKNSDAFESTFWSGGDLTAIYRDITGSGEAPADMARIFESGFR
jgi:biopolymer transport protein TolQ